MENLSCHSIQSANAKAIKNNIFVEASAMNISAKFQVYPLLQSFRFIPYIASEELIF